jgi:hypothetical protein
MATWAGVGRPPITSQTSGRPTASKARLTAAVANRKPCRCTSATRIGTRTMPPTLAPVRASVIARPWRRPNQGSSVLLRPVELRHDHDVAITT